MTSSPSNTYLLGAATETITPADPLWLAGYAARTEPAKDKIADLTASAVALQDRHGHRLVIASVDLIAITTTLSVPIYDIVHRKTGLRPDQIVLAATHTHYGPEFRPDKALFFHIPPEYAARIPAAAAKLAAQIALTIIRAVDNLKHPVHLSARKTTATFAHNRRRLGVKGGTPSTEDTLDQDVFILEATDATDPPKIRSTLFGYACHNTTLPLEDCRYCPDWAGFAKQRLKELHPENTPLFLTGCGADQNPEPRGSLDLSMQYGRELAEAIEASRTSASPPTTPGSERSDDPDSSPRIQITSSIRTARHEVPLPLKPITPADLQAMLASDDPPKRVKAQFLLDQLSRNEPLITTYPAPIQTIRLGDELLLLLLSGEPVVDWSLKFKHAFANSAPVVWTAGYCNDMYGYVPTRRIQQEGGYEGGRANLWSWLPSPFTDDLEPTLTDAVRQLVKRVT